LPKLGPPKLAKPGVPASVKLVEATSPVIEFVSVIVTVMPAREGAANPKTSTAAAIAGRASRRMSLTVVIDFLHQGSPCRNDLGADVTRTGAEVPAHSAGAIRRPVCVVHRAPSIEMEGINESLTWGGAEKGHHPGKWLKKGHPSGHRCESATHGAQRKSKRTEWEILGMVRQVTPARP
jgi:hypothetical protein